MSPLQRLAAVSAVCLGAGAAPPAGAGSDLCPGDCAPFGGDGNVDIIDFIAVIGQWGTADASCDVAPPEAIVDIGDFLLVLSAWGPCPNRSGACCLLADLACIESTRTECEAELGGLFLGEGVRCVDSHCVIVAPVLGACCTPDQGCLQLESFACANIGGLYAGENVPCDAADCCTCSYGPEVCEYFDCNQNGVIDTCDVASGTSQDCNRNGAPDECEDDCNRNGIDDQCELAGNDCNSNGVPDSCDPDCDGNNVPDDCELAADPGLDCDQNDVLDSCELDGDDCNGNSTPDHCEIAAGLAPDCNGNWIPDGCEALPDCDGDGTPDACEFDLPDCNGNGAPDLCDILAGTSLDLDNDSIPDECLLACAVDLDIDSDNSGRIDQTPAEDAVETRLPGKLIPVNDDDDNGNSIPDAEEPPGLPGNPFEDDLAPLKLSLACSDAKPTEWVLYYPEDRVRIYADPARITPVPAGAAFAPPVPSTLYVEAIAVSLTPGDVVIQFAAVRPGPLAVPIPNIPNFDTILATCFELSIRKIDFQSGITLYDAQDDKQLADPEWNLSPASNLPAAYVRSGTNLASSRRLDVQMFLEPALTWEFGVKADSSQQVVVVPKLVPFKKGSAFPKMEFDIQHTTVQRLAPLTLKWSGDMFGGTGGYATPAKATVHTLYLVAAQPIKIVDDPNERPNDRLYYQYYAVGCKWAENTECPGCVFNALWANVQLLNKSPYGYYCPVAQTLNHYAVSPRQLIKSKNGRCGAWAKWFIRLNETHGIDVDHVGLSPDAQVGAPVNEAATIFYVKNWGLPQNAPAIGAVGLLIDQAGIPGQVRSGMQNPCAQPAYKWFPNHCITIYTHPSDNVQRLYDPSYGTSYGQAGDNFNKLLQRWDDASLDFLASAKFIAPGNGAAKVQKGFYTGNNIGMRDVSGNQTDRGD